MLRGGGGGQKVNVIMMLIFPQGLYTSPLNEADYTSVIVRTVGPEERQRRCEVGVVVRRWCCSAHTGNEVSSCVGGVVEQS